MKHGNAGKKKKMKFVIMHAEAPYPHQVWVRQVGSNGRIFNASELMGKRAAVKSINSIINSIKSGRYEIVEVRPKKRQK